MKALSLKITENDYLIRLRKEDFDIHFIYQLLKNMQSEYPSDMINLQSPADHIFTQSADRENFTRFDDLRDK